MILPHVPSFAVFTVLLLLLGILARIIVAPSPAALLRSGGAVPLTIASLLRVVLMFVSAIILMMHLLVVLMLVLVNLGIIDVLSVPVVALGVVLVARLKRSC